MRLPAALAFVPWLAACGAPSAPCTPETCAEACNRRGVLVSTDPGFIPAHVLYPEVAALLRPELDDLRAGLVVEPAASGVCGGASGDCVGFFSTADLPVPPGTHRLVVTHRTPRLARDADWKWTLDERCAVEIVTDGVAVPSIEPRITTGMVSATQGRMERLVVAEVTAPAERPRTCTWKVRFEGPEGRLAEAAGVYAVPATSPSDGPSPAPPAAPTAP